MRPLPPHFRNRSHQVRRRLAGLAAGSAFAFMACMTPAAAQSETKDTEICVLAGIEVPKAQDRDCPTDALAALRAFYIPYEAPKLNAEKGVMPSRSRGPA